MKKSILIVAVIAMTMAANSQTVLYQDDFESYSSGDYLAVVNPGWWTTWSNLPGTGEDIRVSDNNADSGTKSAIITWEDGITDALLKLGDKTSGVFELAWKMFVESGSAAYYNLQHFESPGVEFAFEVYFNSDGTGTLNVGGDSYGFDYPHDTWFTIRHLFNIDEDSASLYIDNEAVHNWPLHYEIGGTDGTNQLGAIDFNDASGFKYYIDDIEYDVLDLTGIWTDNHNLHEISLSMYPNPAAEHVSITSDEDITELEVVDQVGRTIYKQAVGNSFLDLDISGYSKGVYFIRVKSDFGMSVRKLMVQ